MEQNRERDGRSQTLMDWWLLCLVAQSICIECTESLWQLFAVKMASILHWSPCICRAHYSSVALVILETAYDGLFSAAPPKSQVSTCSCIFTFGCLDVFFSFLFKTCSKPRLKLTLLRDRCRDEVPIIWSTELFVANNRSNKIGSCRTGIHVIAVSKVITDLALVQAFCLPKHWMEVKEANDYPYSGQSWSINPISIPLTQQQKTVVDF